jgi:hypothetical protein
MVFIIQNELEVVHRPTLKKLENPAFQKLYLFLSSGDVTIEVAKILSDFLLCRVLWILCLVFLLLSLY